MDTKHTIENNVSSTNKKTLSPIRTGLAALLIGTVSITSGCYFTAKHIIQSTWPAQKTSAISGKKQYIKPDDGFLEAMGKDILIIGSSGAILYKVTDKDEKSQKSTGEYENPGHGGY